LFCRKSLKNAQTWVDFHWKERLQMQGPREFSIDVTNLRFIHASKDSITAFRVLTLRFLKSVKSASAIILALLTLGAAMEIRAEDPIAPTGPATRSLDRYSHIWTAKPFVAATVVTPQAESIVQRYAITGYARFGGSDMVFILDRVSLTRFAVTALKPVQGVELLEVTEKAGGGRLKARIRASGEVAEVAYDAGAAGMAMGGENPGMIGSNVPNPPGVAMPPPQPGVVPNQGNSPRRQISAPRPIRVVPRKNIQGQ